jgi:hypothetical protein
MDNLSDGRYGIGYCDGRLIYTILIKDGKIVKEDLLTTSMEFIIRSGECNIDPGKPSTLTYKYNLIKLYL